MRNFYKGVFFILLSTVGFSLLPIFARFAYANGVNVFTLLVFRFAIASVILLPYVFIKLKKIKLTRHQMITLFVLGGVLYTSMSTFYFYSVKYITPSLAVLGLYTYPIFVSILSAFFEKEKMNTKMMASMGLSFLGIVFIVSRSIGAIDIRGIVFALVASIIYSCYILLANRILKEVSSIVSSSFVSLSAALGLSAVGLVSGVIRFDFQPGAWTWIIGLALFSTILAILTFFWGLELLGSTSASVLSMTEPLFTVLFSILLLKDQLTLPVILGGLCIMVGAMLITLTKGKNESMRKGLQREGLDSVL